MTAEKLTDAHTYTVKTDGALVKTLAQVLFLIPFGLRICLEFVVESLVEEAKLTLIFEPK